MTRPKGIRVPENDNAEDFPIDRERRAGIGCALIIHEPARCNFRLFMGAVRRGDLAAMLREFAKRKTIPVIGCQLIADASAAKDLESGVARTA